MIVIKLRPANVNQNAMRFFMWSYRFNTWKNEFERNVMKGQKGIKIIAPAPFKVKQQQEKTDPATGKLVIGADGKPVMEEVEKKIPAYFALV